MKKRFVVLFAMLLGLIALVVPTTSAQEGQLLSQVRVAHFAPDAPTVEIFVNGEPSGIQFLSYGEVSGWVQLPAGTYSVAVVPFGGGIEDAVIGPASVRLAPGTWTTVAATGFVGDGTLGASVFTEDYSAIAAGDTRVTVFHAIPDAPAVDVILPDGTAIVSNLRFGQATSLTVPAGTYDLAVVAAGTTEPAVLSLSGVGLGSQTFYLVSAVNSLAAPGVNVQVIGQNVVSPLFGNVFTTRNIAQIAAADGRFNTLVTALQLTGLDEALAGPGPFTVFAPTDAAFAALPEGVLDSLIADTDALTSVLLLHVLSGRAFASDVVGVSGLNMLQGSITVNVDEDGNVFLNDTVQIIITDIQATNGVIHVIDAVLVP